MGKGLSCPSGSAGGVTDSYNGDGCRGVPIPRPTLADKGAVFDDTCKLTLRLCPLAGLIPVGRLGMDGLLSLGESLPSDMIESDLPCPLADCTKGLFEALACSGALRTPALDDALTTLSDNAGLCPLEGGASLAPTPEGVLDGVGRFWAIEAPRLGAADVAYDGVRPCPYPLTLASGVCTSSPCSSSTFLPMFLNVIMHSISSPEYTVGSLHCTYARMFEGAAAGGMALEARAVDLVRASSPPQHTQNLALTPPSFAKDVAT